jgi:hypothetical protein
LGCSFFFKINELINVTTNPTGKISANVISIFIAGLLYISLACSNSFSHLILVALILLALSLFISFAVYLSIKSGKSNAPLSANDHINSRSDQLIQNQL